MRENDFPRSDRAALEGGERPFAPPVPHKPGDDHCHHDSAQHADHRRHEGCRDALGRAWDVAVVRARRSPVTKRAIAQPRRAVARPSPPTLVVVGVARARAIRREQRRCARESQRPRVESDRPRLMNAPDGHGRCVCTRRAQHAHVEREALAVAAGRESDAAARTPKRHALQPSRNRRRVDGTKQRQALIHGDGKREDGVVHTRRRVNGADSRRCVGVGGHVLLRPRIAEADRRRGRIAAARAQRNGTSPIGHCAVDARGKRPLVRARRNTGSAGVRSQACERGIPHAQREDDSQFLSAKARKVGSRAILAHARNALGRHAQVTCRRVKGGEQGGAVRLGAVVVHDAHAAPPEKRAQSQQDARVVRFAWKHSKKRVLRPARDSWKHRIARRRDQQRHPPHVCMHSRCLHTIGARGSDNGEWPRGRVRSLPRVVPHVLCVD
eukprot:Opistho-1_new@31897